MYVFSISELLKIERENLLQLMSNLDQTIKVQAIKILSI